MNLNEIADKARADFARGILMEDGERETIGRMPRQDERDAYRNAFRKAQAVSMWNAARKNRKNK